MLGLLKKDGAQNKEKTQEAVRRSRETWFGRITGLLRGPRLDDAVWDQVEELLVSADIGVSTSLSVIERMKAQAQDEGIIQPEQLFQALKRELVASLDSGSSPDVWLGADNGTTPFVILMAGVNGSGKTTSIAKLAYHFKEAGKNGSYRRCRYIPRRRHRSVAAASQ